MRPPERTLTLASAPAGDGSPLPEELRRKLIQSRGMNKKRRLENDSSAFSLDLDRVTPLSVTPEGTTISESSAPATLAERNNASRQDFVKGASDSEEGEISEDEEPPSATPMDLETPTDVEAPPMANVQSAAQPTSQPHTMLQQRWYDGRDPSEPARPGTLDNSITVSDLVESKLHILDLLAQGFPKEDLINVINLPPKFIVVVFSELGLRLPTNIRPEDIPPLPFGSPVPRIFHESGIPSEAIRWQTPDKGEPDRTTPVQPVNDTISSDVPPPTAMAITQPMNNTETSRPPQSASQAPPTQQGDLPATPLLGESMTTVDTFDAGKTMAQLRDVLIGRRAQGARTPVSVTPASAPPARRTLTSYADLAPPSGPSATSHARKRGTSSVLPSKPPHHAPNRKDRPTATITPVIVAKHPENKSPGKKHTTPWPRSRDSLPPPSPPKQHAQSPSATTNGAAPPRRMSCDTLLQEKLAKLKASQKMREATKSPSLSTELTKATFTLSPLLSSVIPSTTQNHSDSTGTVTKTPPPLSFTLSPSLVKETIAGSMVMPSLGQLSSSSHQPPALQSPRQVIPLPRKPSDPPTSISTVSSPTPTFPQIPTRTLTLDSATYPTRGKAANKRLRATDLMDESSHMSFYGPFTNPGNFIPGLSHFSACVIEVSDEEEDETEESSETSEDEDEESTESVVGTAALATQEVGTMADAFLGPIFEELVPKTQPRAAENADLVEDSPGQTNAGKDPAEEIRKLKRAIALAEERAAKRAKRDTSSPAIGFNEQVVTSEHSGAPSISGDAEMADGSSTAPGAEGPEEDIDVADDMFVVDDNGGQRPLSITRSSSVAFGLQSGSPKEWAETTDSLSYVDDAIRTRLTFKEPQQGEVGDTATASTNLTFSPTAWAMKLMQMIAQVTLTPTPLNADVSTIAGPGPSKLHTDLSPIASFVPPSDNAAGHPTHPKYWSKYQSPLGSAGPSPFSFGTNVPQDAVSHAQGVVDLAPLRLQALNRHAQERALCPFEIPGGGTCVDTTCPYAHMRDLQPTDEEVAQFLTGIFASLTVPQVVDEFKTSLKGGSQDLSARVMLVLDKLGLR
ncbi:hypothetical protein FRB95_005224 [Tulasnella sp. JGI-2019a]|nr:hypothetical protein FRB95_005224 [Tulasnella sp. JGI-2019a]